MCWDNRYKLEESNPKAEKLSRVNYAFVGAMGGLARSVPDVMDGGGGVYPQSPQPERKLLVLDLRGGAQHAAHDQLQPSHTGFCGGCYAACR